MFKKIKKQTPDGNYTHLAKSTILRTTSNKTLLTKCIAEQQQNNILDLTLREWWWTS